MINTTRDVPNLITYDLQNGNVLRAERKDPYGHWFLSLEKGLLPERFHGGYTGRDEVEKAALAYSKYRDILLGKQPERPELKLKKIKD